MKKSDLQLFKPFINSNGYLSIVYKKSNNGKLSIINYNCSIYELTGDDISILKYKEIDISIEEFFEKFPVNNFSNNDARKIYLSIERDFYTKYREESQNRVLLLII